MSKPEKLYCARCGIRIDGEQAIEEAKRTLNKLCGLCLDDDLNDKIRQQLNQAAENFLKGMNEQTTTSR